MAAGAVPHYGCMEAGFIGEGCLQPTAPDDVHLFHDLNAVIPAGAAGPDAVALPPNALLLTSLRPTAPLILLNVSLGDQARVSQRRCGCPIERAGWTTHLQAIRSFEKLTAGGMTFLDREAIAALEETLPGRFGDLVGDYQLIEEQDPAGRSRLVLLVSPRVGPVDAAAVGSAFLAAIGATSPAARLTELLWRESGTLRVERREPVATTSGKVLHIHAVDRPVGSHAAEASGR